MAKNQKHKISFRKASSGFALLEALIAILLFSIGILGMVAMQAKAAQISGNSEDRTKAAMLANDLVALMWAQDSTTVGATDLTAWQARVTAALPSGQGSVTTDSCGNTEVNVAWTVINRTAATSAASTAASSASGSCTTGFTAPSGANAAFSTKVIIPS